MIYPNSKMFFPIYKNNSGPQPGPDYSTMPLTFESIGNTAIQINKNNLSYNKKTANGQETGWQSYNLDYINLNNGETVSFSGTNEIIDDRFVTSGNGTLKVYGNCNSIVNYVDQVGNGCFRDLFQYCNNIIDASQLKLPARILNIQSYWGMFYGCTGLQRAPIELPATGLAEGCYACMFLDCTSLTSVPTLPATTLALSCYYKMFAGCTALIHAPSILCERLDTNCCWEMFKNCSNLTTPPPSLPALTLANQCYRWMFRDCTSLTAAPTLPATQLAYRCYNEMFRGCTALSTPPSLPALTAYPNCYDSMFLGCTSLTAAPQLPATTLIEGWNYYYMFAGCSNLVKAPSSLPALTVASYGYAHMFENCSSLLDAPQLPATTLANYCYNSMFRNCHLLSSINVSFTEWGNATDYWVSEDIGIHYGVAASGIFRKPSILEEEYSTSRIPANWNIVDK